MQKFLQQTRLSGSAILALYLITLMPAIAQEVHEGTETSEARSQPDVQVIDQELSSSTPIVDTTSLEPLGENSNQDSADENALSQVTSVSQLSDVQPTDWAFQALQLIVERYGCIAGYGDGTFRGNRALTRYEFAAGLNACLDKITTLVGTGKTDQVPQQDLATLQKLREDFADELTDLQRRVDTLQARTAELEARQFSTTTKLNGFAIFNLTGATAGRGVQVEGASTLPPIAFRVPDGNGNLVPFRRTVTDDPNITLSGLSWLSLNTSFTGRDVLVTKLSASNGRSPANEFVSAGQYNTTGVPFFDQTAGPNPGQADVIIGELFYSFPVGDAVRLTVGPRVNWFYHFDFNPFTIPFTGAASFNAINSPFFTSTRRGAGAVVEWNINRQLALHAGYMADSTEFLPSPRPAVDPSKGLFDGTHTITAELTFKPAPTANIRLLYQRSFLNPVFGQISDKPIVGVADDGFGGAVNDANADTFGVNFDWLVSRRIGLFGRYYYSSTNIDPVTPGIASGDVNAQNIQAGLALPDLGKQGAVGTLSFVVPFDVLKGRNFLVAGGGNGGTQYEIEANYFYPLNNNVAIVPSFYVINNINNFTDNPTVFVGNLRTQFRF